MKCHKKVVIRGRVQGVWFRKYAKDKADGFGLSGYVKNEFDGTVYIEVSGENEQVNTFIQWCHAGPPLAHVETVEVNENDVHHKDGFSIKN